MKAHSDLEALAKCLTAFEGSAMPIVRIPGGQSAGSPAEHVQPHLSAARRALHRLAWMRGMWPTHVRLLLAAYVRAGDEARMQRGWLADVYLALLSRRERWPYLAARGGADIAALRASAAKVLEQAEGAYEEAGEMPSDGRWLSLELDVISRCVRDLEAHRAEFAPKPKAKKLAPAPSVCAPAPAPLDCPALAPCVRRGGGLVNAHPCVARAKGRRRGVSCRRPRVDRWIVRGPALVVSERSGTRAPVRTVRPSKTWGLLLEASQSG